MVVSNIRRASTSFLFQSLIASSLRSGPSTGTGAACPSIGAAACKTSRICIKHMCFRFFLFKFVLFKGKFPFVRKHVLGHPFV